MNAQARLHTPTPLSLGWNPPVFSGSSKKMEREKRSRVNAIQTKKFDSIKRRAIYLCFDTWYPIISRSSKVPYRTVPYRTVRTEDSDVTGLKILAETNFQNREWDSDEEKSEQIRNEERTPTVLNRESRKSPDIAKADCRTRGREVKGCPRTPKFTCLGLVLAVGFGGSR